MDDEYSDLVWYNHTIKNKGATSMNKFVPYEKMSKKAKRELDRKKRTTWQAINPFTHIADTSKKAYKRHPKYGVSDDL